MNLINLTPELGKFLTQLLIKHSKENEANPESYADILTSIANALAFYLAATIVNTSSTKERLTEGLQLTCELVANHANDLFANAQKDKGMWN